MANVYLSLSWDDHKRSICSGLGNLQQNGELVDMTLAADGHHVKVHKLIMSLVSPYLKDLIASADCPHPIIFLHNLSFTTLSSLLEYIYTGEVHIRHTELPDFLAAGKALQIKGLIDMEDKRMYIKQDRVKRKAEQVLNTLQKKALLEKINDQKDDETCNTPSIDTEQHPTHKSPSLTSNMNITDGKKKRGSNYTAGERSFLLDIVKKYQDILENKKTTGKMTRKKRETWEFVCQQYNNTVAVSGIRTWQQLRHLYENHKQSLKKNIAKKDVNRKGGGAYQSTRTEEDGQILAMLAPHSQPLSNPCDDNP